MISHGQAAQIPYGFADTEGGVLYVEGADGHLDCLDMASGEVLARTEFPAQALAVTEGHVIGWRSGIPQPNALVLFKAQRCDGTLSPIWQRTLELPDWVDTQVRDPDRFTLSADVDDELVITWEAHSRYSGGAPPPTWVQIARTHDERRHIRIDTTSGEVVSEEPGEIGEERIEEAVRKLPLVSYRLGRSWVNRPWHIGSRDVLLLHASYEPGIVLRYRDPSGRAPEVDIQLTKDGATEPVVTPDGSLILTHEPDRTPSEWKFFSAETGEQIASLPYETGTEDAAVIGSRVLYVVAEIQGTPPTCRRLLRCRDLESGALIWSHLLGETPVRPAPPLPA